MNTCIFNLELFLDFYVLTVYDWSFGKAAKFIINVDTKLYGTAQCQLESRGQTTRAV